MPSSKGASATAECRATDPGPLRGFLVLPGCARKRAGPGCLLAVAESQARFNGGLLVVVFLDEAHVWMFGRLEMDEYLQGVVLPMLLVSGGRGRDFIDEETPRKGGWSG